jgi:hypothetical protein
VVPLPAARKIARAPAGKASGIIGIIGMLSLPVPALRIRLRRDDATARRRPSAPEGARQIRIVLKGEPTRRGEREKRKGEHVEGTREMETENYGKTPAGNQFSRNEREISARRTSNIRRVTMI